MDVKPRPGLLSRLADAQRESGPKWSWVRAGLYVNLYLNPKWNGTKFGMNKGKMCHLPRDLHHAFTPKHVKLNGFDPDSELPQNFP